MTQEEKQLLLKDLCARVPYGVKILDIPANVVGNLFLVSTTDTVEYETNNSVGSQTLYNIKPHLRPLSSMTEEEENEYRAINCYEGLFPRNEDALDYVLSHHLDFRGLIPMGLALEAPEGMYKTE
ncbi:MAG: hypothetical protein IKH15_09175 [Bacteroidales bacterium]|nr:hypothetical protein [Bacteroidales bacterium]